MSKNNGNNTLTYDIWLYNVFAYFCVEYGKGKVGLVKLDIQPHQPGRK